MVFPTTRYAFFETKRHREHRDNSQIMQKKNVFFMHGLRVASLLSLPLCFKKSISCSRKNHVHYLKKYAYPLKINNPVLDLLPSMEMFNE